MAKCLAECPFNTCNALTNKKAEKKCALKYSEVIDIVHDVIADVVDVNMKTRPLASDDRRLICALRVEKGWGCA